MYMRMKFYVDGTKRKGTVHLDLKKVRSAANVLWQAHTIHCTVEPVPLNRTPLGPALFSNV